MSPRIAFFLAAAAWLLPVTALASAPWGIRLSNATPDATTTAGIAWNTDSAATETIVEYGRTTAYGQTATDRKSVV